MVYKATSYVTLPRMREISPASTLVAELHPYVGTQDVSAVRPCDKHLFFYCVVLYGCESWSLKLREHTDGV
jgi:hypothetical protein